ncbi:hypothetical protein VOLCADRAFT_115914 [Volvox carteri f. nagariensis]|uniref:Uncharacterized protein n=1 Tax=Volvox carteri f. nagariensis TaxID=3068 RepID=D8TIW8_VOLCA|nr:uncharacterized protein VOLCADRAFT_115914 [Volvox carteri f. nagariensis]EFJ52440.1 hypothetical protein VOLCADRAFT_115914 [Volvox carteri f. nagariensis]|eukprot:XP_002946513.1 hypothetical protein VOLCADRAFT_115914 [Volvox carteri f. nagariensis]
MPSSSAHRSSRSHGPGLPNGPYVRCTHYPSHFTPYQPTSPLVHLPHLYRRTLVRGNTKAAPVVAGSPMGPPQGPGPQVLRLGPRPKATAAEAVRFKRCTAVFYIPPLTGTELQAKLDNKYVLAVLCRAVLYSYYVVLCRTRPSAPRWWCPRRTSSWFRLWVNLESVLPWAFPCFADNMRLVPGYPGDSGAVSPPGVEVRLGPTLESPRGDPRVAEGPWSSVVRELRQRGWTDELLYTHAYDWRLSPPEWSRAGGSFQQLHRDITTAVAASGGRRVVLLGLSLGASYAVSFLTSPLVDPTWREKHIGRLVTMSGVWTGTPRATWDVLSGRLEGLEAVLDRGAALQLLRGLPALTWAFPSPPPGVGPGEAGGPAVITNTARGGRSYGPAQLGQALGDAGAEETAAFWEAALPYTLTSPPNVPTHCFYSYGLRCAVHVTYNTADFSDTQPAVRYDDGDVTVPHASLAACRGWAVRQMAPVRSYSYFGVVHGMLTSVPEALHDIVEAIASEAA